MAASQPNVPHCPDAFRKGRNAKEAVANIKDAIEGYLVILKKHDEPIPPPIGEDVRLE